jgi:hypothetical protein
MNYEEARREATFFLNSTADRSSVGLYSISVDVRGRPKNNRNLNMARELEVVARCAATCRESTQYSSSLPRGVSLG